MSSFIIIILLNLTPQIHHNYKNLIAKTSQQRKAAIALYTVWK